MSTFKDKGIILKEFPKGDHDKNLVLLLKDKGKVTVFAKGAQRPKNKFFSGAQRFSFCEFVIFEGNGFLSLTQIQVLNNFYNISQDYDAFCCASFYLELVNKMIHPSMPCADTLYLLVKTLYHLSKGIINPHLVAAIFEFKFLQLEGYSPETEVCSECGMTIEHTEYFGTHGIFCRKCLHSNTLQFIQINDPVVYVLKYILNTSPANLFRFRVTEDVVDILKACSQFFILNNIDIPLQSGYFFNKG